jgi:hypothetical protein
MNADPVHVDCEIGDSGATVLAKALESNRSIKRIYLLCKWYRYLVLVHVVLIASALDSERPDVGVRPCVCQRNHVQQHSESVELGLCVHCAFSHCAGTGFLT